MRFVASLWQRFATSRRTIQQKFVSKSWSAWLMPIAGDISCFASPVSHLFKMGSCNGQPGLVYVTTQWTRSGLAQTEFESGGTTIRRTKATRTPAIHDRVSTSLADPSKTSPRPSRRSPMARRWCWRSFIPCARSTPFLGPGNLHTSVMCAIFARK